MLSGYLVVLSTKKEFSHMASPQHSAEKPIRRLPGRHLVTLIISIVFLVFTTASVLASFTPGMKTAHAASWNLVWQDEFSGGAGTGVNSSNWLYDLGTGYGCAGCPSNWGTGEVETMTNSTNNVFQDGSGHLAIKPIRDGAGNWTSGRIETQRTDFAAPAGGILAVEASIQQPNVSGAVAAGYWPAFWMLGNAFRGNYLNWPGIGEIDILEDVNGLSSEFATLHCGTSPGGPCNETTGKGSGQHACPGCQTGFHTYRMEYDRSVSPEQIRWYLDGTQFFTINSSELDATTWNNATHHSFFIILDLAMGGGFPAAFGGGPTASTLSGVPMLVDYVRVYTASGSTSTPTPTPTSTGCTGDFTQGVASGTTPWFKPCGWTAGYVILHYTPSGQSQQNVNMSFNSGTARWEYAIGGLSTGQPVTYSFTYQRAGLQYDTGTYSFTFGGSGATPTPTPTPTSCTGTFNQGVVSASSSSAVPWFQPCNWTAGYVILHYTVPGQSQQNVNMSFNSGTSRWEFTVNGISSGQTLTYSFTYQRAGLQYDTGTYTWTHP
jgi:hypothetical protein